MIGAHVEPQRDRDGEPEQPGEEHQRIGFQFERINAASAMNPRPSAVPSRQFPITSAARKAPDSTGERAREQHALVPVDRDAHAERPRRLGVLAARAQSQSPPGRFSEYQTGITMSAATITIGDRPSNARIQAAWERR